MKGWGMENEGREQSCNETWGGPDRETTFVKFSEFKAKTKKLGVLKLEI